MPHPSPMDTICAVATPPGQGGLGVVRLSGALSRGILKRLWRGHVPPSDFEPKKLYLGRIEHALPRGERQEAGGGLPVSDIALAVFMPAPATYTGEDVVEFSAHGSPVILGKILESCVSLGARPAEPGEFTRRAFLAGKLDLAQAEGVCDLIAATGERAARIASDQLSGRLSREVTAIADTLVDLRASVEASIDFPEEEIELIEETAIAKRLIAISERIEGLAKTFHEGRLVREGARTAIVGRPNAGKSSVFNRLAGTERAIVHRAPGTTRDVVEEAVAIDGIVFRLRDTAGIRRTPCDVEGLGVEKSRGEIATADLIVAVFDGSAPFCPEDDEVLRAIDPGRTIPVINKADVAQTFDRKDLEKYFPGAEPLSISAKTGTGFEKLRASLVSKTSSGAGHQEGVLVSSLRHKAALDEAVSILSEAHGALESKKPAECIAQHLRSAQDSIGRITGSVTDEDLLGRIFSRFCIGK